MRDGTVLRADVYRPDTDARVPVIVIRTPYDRSNALVAAAGIDPARAVDAGFAVVCQDIRGRFASEGRFQPFVDEPHDGYDTIEWAAAQPWSTGAVGMAGRSYGGAAQWLAAAERPPHLKALFPVAIGSNFFDGWIYQGGAFQLGFNLFWALLIDAPKEAARAATHGRHLPLATVPVLRDHGRAPFYFDWIEHSTDDDFWRRLAVYRHYGRVDVPCYNVTGWYDVFLGGTLDNFTRMQAEGGSEVARRGQKLLVGPWGHGSTYGPYPDHAYPAFAPSDAVDLAEVQLRFFARHLKGERNGIEDEPPVRIFVMGENRWRDEGQWPLARTRYTPWYFHGPAAPGAAGALSEAAPVQEAPEEYVYDPRDPAPTVGGPTSLPALLFGSSSGPHDQRRVEERPDVLTYTSAPLERALETTGPLQVRLFAATSAPDTDFVAKLMDVGPDGESRILAEGILRARFREGFDQPKLVQPGEVHAYSIDLKATAHVFAAGRRVRVAVTSSSFPRFDRNPNTGRALGVDGPEDLRPARQTVFHDRDRPSHVLLPVIPR
jgi:hypothetical protein